MYGLFTYIWLIVGVNIDTYSIPGAVVLAAAAVVL